jgi:hypothetical protein
MRSGNLPFRFDLRSIAARASRLSSSVDGVTLNLPFVSINLKATDVDRSVARELVIRLADRRVLNAYECCDGCIDQALASLQEIRRALVDAQVRLQDRTEGPLYLVLEAMVAGLRQFLTFEQHLKRGETEDLQMYFDALEMLRAHLYRCLDQVALVADLTVPRVPEAMRYAPAWHLEAYEPIKKLGDGA